MTIRGGTKRVNREATAGAARDRRALAVPGRAGVPLYLRLRDALAEAISAGRWLPGEQLPAEYELATLSQRSVGTVQRALGLLVKEGILVRRHGAGTFVSAPEAPLVASFLHAQFLDEATGRLLAVFAHVPRRSRSPRAGAWSQHLPGSDVMCVERTQSVAREFLVYTRLYFDASRFPSLASVDLRSLDGKSLKDSMSRELRSQVARHAYQLQVRAFPAEVCRAMKRRASCVGAILEVVAYDRGGEAVYFQDFHIPPNGRRLIVTP